MEVSKVLSLSLTLVTTATFVSTAPITEPANIEAVNVVVKGSRHSPHLTYHFPMLTAPLLSFARQFPIRLISLTTANSGSTSVFIFDLSEVTFYIMVFTILGTVFFTVITTATSCSSISPFIFLFLIVVILRAPHHHRLCLTCSTV